MAHTPGPWEIEKDWMPDDNLPIKSTTKGFRVAYAAPLPIIGLEKSKAAESANARLIAAAPELLKACKAMYSELRKVCQEAGLSVTHETVGMQAGSKAIAKATGETHVNA